MSKNDAKKNPAENLQRDVEKKLIANKYLLVCAHHLSSYQYDLS
jgi:hypothetical protein